MLRGVNWLLVINFKNDHFLENDDLNKNISRLNSIPCQCNLGTISYCIKTEVED